MSKAILRRCKYEIFRRINRYRRGSGYRSVNAVFGKTHRVVYHDAQGRERRLDLRAGTSDYPLFWMTFRTPQYDTSEFARHDDIQRRYREIVSSGRRPLIVDAGANIGLASLYFRDRYPEALIVAVEPEWSNFEMMTKLLRDDPHCILLRAALANFDGSVEITDPGLGAVGFRTEKAESGIPAHRLESIVEIARQRDRIEPFILKVDVEGFERDLFDDTEVFDDFFVAFIELHDWMLPKQRTSASFLKAVAPLDRDFLLFGENVLSIRNSHPAADADLAAT